MSLRRAARVVLEAEVWVVGALALAGVLEERFLLAAVGTAALFWLIGLLAGVRRAALGGVWPVAALAGLVALQIYLSPLPPRSLLEALRIMAWVGLFLGLAGWVKNPGRLNLAVAGLAVLGMALAAVALFTVQWGDRKLPLLPLDLLNHLPKFGESVNPNVMAGGLVILAPWLGAWWLFNVRRLGLIGTVALGGVLLFIGSVVVLTQSRAGYMGLASGFALLLILRWKRLGTALVLGGGLLVGVILLAPSSPIPREVIFNSSMQASLQGRELIWSQANLMLRNFPLTGVGLGCYGPVADRLFPVVSKIGVTHAHNLFLQVGVELGWPGLVVWLGLLTSLLAEGWALYRAPAPLRGVGAGLLAALLAMSVHGTWDAVTWGTRMAFMPWLIWGVSCGARQIVPDWA